MYPIPNEFVEAETRVFWDIVDCPIPKNLTPDSIYENIKSALVDMGYLGNVSISAYSDLQQNPKDFESSSPITLLPTGDKHVRRNSILEDFMRWGGGKRRKRSPYNLMLISGDISKDALYLDYIFFMNDRYAKANVLLAQSEIRVDAEGKVDEDLSELLLDHVSTVWLWTSLSSGGKPILETLPLIEEEDVWDPLDTSWKVDVGGGWPSVEEVQNSLECQRDQSRIIEDRLPTFGGDVWEPRNMLPTVKGENNLFGGNIQAEEVLDSSISQSVPVTQYYSWDNKLLPCDSVETASSITSTHSIATCKLPNEHEKKFLSKVSQPVYETQCDFVETEFRKTETCVFWDIGDCPIPQNLSPDSIYTNIKSALVDMGYVGNLSIRAYSDLQQNPEDFESSKITLFPTGDKYKRCYTILEHFMLWAYDQWKRPFNLMFISQDILKDVLYFESIQFWNERGGTFLLALPEKNLPHDDLSRARHVSTIWLWKILSCGGKPMDQSSISQPVSETEAYTKSYDLGQ